jgi:endonuclease/exonuclease/phosphatase family metal-dependent hydrolase
MLRTIRQNLIFCLLFGIIPNSLLAQALPISAVQGTGTTSAYEGQVISTTGNIVTARGSGFFFIQSPPAAADDDPLTAEGLLVLESYFGSVGDVVSVTGMVVEEDGMTALANAVVTPAGSHLPLPPAVVLDDNLPSPDPASVHSFERLEGMRVQFSAVANGPSSSFETAPLRIGNERVFREPGIGYPGLPGLPVWDSNPELFWFDPNGLNAPNNRFIATGARVEAEAVLLEAGSRFWIALATDYSLADNATDASAVRPKAANEYTVGSLNLLRYFEDEPDFSLKTSKLVRYIGEQMRWPDILAVQEAGSLAALNALCDALQARYPTVSYNAYLLPSNSAMKSGFLVRDNLQNVQLTQLGASEVFTFSGGLLHDRPPLLLRATLPAEKPVNVQVLNLHMRSLIGIEGEGGLSEFVRNKRHQQGISVAQMIEELRPDGNLVVLGDFNAFPFTDGYVDVFSQIVGQNSLGALLPPLSITTPPLTSQLQSLPAEQRYSYVFRGSAQALDYCLTADFEGLTANGLQYARGNADFPEAYASNPNLPLRASDHDGLVLFVAPDGTVPAGAAVASSVLNLVGPNPIRQGQTLQLKSGTTSLRQLQLYSANGQLLEQRGLQAAQYAFTWPRLPAGVYILVLQNERETARYRVLSLD